ncbi:hypothetical protein Hypma_008733 [Hypsizygus marmoreus]|uniref:PhoD-like phosphatase domain-containing protein n=1 Tax=Hypsizygus marmoreus TaxID=39966 RepID=A0A369JSG7_HYPMA|nr:hypothetical protein Hypma_008733 [Hypsizygus marmoreus]
MDVPGWHAQRRARKEDELLSIRRPDGRYQYQQSEDLSPMHEEFIGGFHVNQRPPSPLPPALPPKDFPYTQPSYHVQQPTQSTITSSQLSHMTAIERSQTLRVARMNPHLQFMVGPLLRYDTVDEHGIWHGSALVVTADSGSIYEPHPTLTYEWDPDKGVQHQHFQPPRSFDLGPHPADPHSTVLPTSPISPPTFTINGSATSPVGANASRESVPGQEIYVYAGHGGTFTFWRFLLQIPLAPQEMVITYNINSGQQLEFFVPGRAQNMRWAAYSCNGFSAGVNPDDFRGPGFKSGYDPVWVDLLEKHAETPFHALIGGGDQLYCDSLMREPELQEWVSKMKPEDKKNYVLTDEIAAAIDRFFFNHYCQSFRRGAFARANSSIPMMNMCDDHDIVSPIRPVFATIITFYRLMVLEATQMTCSEPPYFKQLEQEDTFISSFFNVSLTVTVPNVCDGSQLTFCSTANVDGISDEPGRHANKSVIIGDQGPYVRSPSHSFLGYLGPQCYILLLDCRAERKKDQVCSPLQYQKVFHRLKQLPPNVEHLVVQLGIPIAYPRMVFLETALESKFNPLVALGRTGTMGLSGFVNKFNAEAELLDDLNDHWTARSHKRERNWLIEQLQLFAKAQRIRVSFLSGDVHCAAVGVLKTLKAKGKPELAPAVDHRYMINVVTSAIVNTPPPNPVISMVSSLATKVHKTLHSIETDETMLPIFQTETNGQPRKQKFIMGRRNWCQIFWDRQTGDLVFDIRVEKEKGDGETVGYITRTPPPAWTRGL